MEASSLILHVLDESVAAIRSTGIFWGAQLGPAAMLAARNRGYSIRRAGRSSLRAGSFAAPFAAAAVARGRQDLEVGHVRTAVNRLATDWRRVSGALR